MFLYLVCKLSKQQVNYHNALFGAFHQCKLLCTVFENTYFTFFKFQKNARIKRVKRVCACVCVCVFSNPRTCGFELVSAWVGTVSETGHSLERGPRLLQLSSHLIRHRTVLIVVHLHIQQRRVIVNFETNYL